MAKIVVLGSGFAGHTAAGYLRKNLGKNHEVVVVTPNSKFQYIPSNIWIGTGKMTSKKTTFPLAPVYKRKNITFKQAKVLTFHPEGDKELDKPYVLVEYTGGSNEGQKEKVTYDYLINATGPKLDFGATEGLYPGKNKTVSVCSFDHAEHAWKELKALIERMKKGEHVKIVVGTGHANATCQGAAFEYILNVDDTLRKQGVRDKADITWISNEYHVGEFGMNEMYFKFGGKIWSGQDLAEFLFEDRGIKYITQSGIYKVEDGVAYYENLDGEKGQIEFDFGMLIPKFSGHGFKAYDKDGNDITDKLFKAFMIVDADYTPKPYEEWSAKDWPETYQNPTYPNIFAAGIAFHPPHTISQPRVSKTGKNITPAPPRTGMPSGIIGRLVAENVAHMINSGNKTPKDKGSMANMGAGCVASTGYGFFSGSAVVMILYPIVPDFEKYPKYGRTIKAAYYGLAGHWMKKTLHHLFIYKNKFKFGWSLIPE